jgi:16S rRNA (cytosine1402-N4)-methyltransferase
LASSCHSSRADVRADVILLDLGVSSMQLDRPGAASPMPRTRPRAWLTQDVSACDVVAAQDERDLVTIFRYGGGALREAIARAIIRRRREQPFERTGNSSTDQVRDSRARPLR